MFKGDRYEETKNLSTVEVAALVRADLKILEAPKGVRFSVRAKYYSGGSSISVVIKGYPGPIHSRERIAWKLGFSDAFPTPEWMDKEAASFLKKVQEILDRYQKDDSDIQTDYFCRRFYDHINFYNAEEDYERQAAEMRKNVK